jgi:hypothetical protein
MHQLSVFVCVLRELSVFLCAYASADIMAPNSAGFYISNFDEFPSMNGSSREAAQTAPADVGESISVEPPAAQKALATGMALLAGVRDFTHLYSIHPYITFILPRPTWQRTSRWSPPPRRKHWPRG